MQTNPSSRRAFAAWALERELVEAQGLSRCCSVLDHPLLREPALHFKHNLPNALVRYAKLSPNRF
jgi:hypothetical protein